MKSRHHLPDFRIAIVGSGAVGLYYGAKLAARGRDVHFLLRSDFSAAHRHGIRVLSKEGDITLQGGHFYQSTSEIGPVDLVIVSLKTTANESLLESLPPLIDERTWLLTLQNGIGNEEFLARAFRTDRVLGGLCFVCLNRTAPAVVQHLGYGTITLGDSARFVRPVVHDISTEFKRCGIPARMAENLASARWEKLVWNIPFNGLTIAAGSVPVSALIASEVTRQEVEALMRETIAAANANGCALSDSLIASLIKRTGTMGDYRPSSLVDFDLGRELELEAIWGEPLRRGENAGVKMPELRKLYTQLQERIASRAPC
jgi:2-dehydropantoate 2-reductase